MSGIWQERVLKKPEDFHAALWAGSCGISEDFALGYATALYDTEAVDVAGLTAYVAASASGAFSHNLDFKANEDRLAEEVDMAAFGVAVTAMLGAASLFPACAEVAGADPTGTQMESIEAAGTGNAPTDAVPDDPAALPELSADDGQVTVTVPTEVPCVMLGDGSIIGPATWSIENKSGTMVCVRDGRRREVGSPIGRPPGADVAAHAHLHVRGGGRRTPTVGRVGVRGLLGRRQQPHTLQEGGRPRGGNRVPRQGGDARLHRH